MGLTEILPRLRSLLGRVSQTAEAVLREIQAGRAYPPIDSPGVLAPRGREGQGARRAGADDPLRRAHGLGVAAETRAQDGENPSTLLCSPALFPFEPPYMEAEGDGLRFSWAIR